MVYINECIDVNTAFKNPSYLWVVRVGSNSFQGISYAGKYQVVSSYSFKSMPGVESFEDLEIENVLNTPNLQFGKHDNILTVIIKTWIEEVKLEQN